MAIDKKHNTIIYLSVREKWSGHVTYFRMTAVPKWREANSYCVNTAS